MIDLKNLFAFMTLWGYSITVIGTILMLTLLIIRDNQLHKAESKAIKNFAERLKDRMFNYYDCLSESAKGRPYKGDTLMDYEVVDMIKDSIDNLVKEMVGE
jgi:hypothetical protein